MDIKAYISSGTLELYVAGALTPQEEREVEELAAGHPEIRAELDEIERAFEALAMHNAAMPRPELRGAILERIARSSEAVSPSPAVDPRVGAGSPPGISAAQRAVVLQLPSRARYLVAASVAVAVASSALAAYFGYRWNQAEEDLALAVAKDSMFTHDRSILKAQLDKSQRDVAVLSNPATVTVRMAGLSPAPQASATVYWDPATRVVYLDPGSLPQAPSGKSYQLWAIADGRPVNAGLVAAADVGLVVMKNVDRAQAFAITLEPAGGSESPTLDAMYVMGKVGISS